LPPKDQRDHPPYLEESQWQEQYIRIYLPSWAENGLKRQNRLLKSSVCLLDFRTINCMVIDMDGSFGYDPGLGSISYHLP
jgi:hypothetical protein